MAAGKRLGVVKNAAPEQSPWTTPHRLEELSGEWRWGDRKLSRRRRSSAVEHAAALRLRWCGCSSAVTVEQAAMMRAWRIGSRMDGEIAAIREEGESGNFYFYVLANSSVACWAVRTSRPVNAHPDEKDALPTTLSNENT
jgi:hypothetical protein